MPTRLRSPRDTDLSATVLVATTGVVASLAITLWISGIVARLASGRGVPHAAMVSGLRTLAHAGDPSAGWRTPMPGPFAYWTCTALAFAVIVSLALLAMRWWRRTGHRARHDLSATTGLAVRRDIRNHASAAALLGRAHILRPSLPEPVAADVGFRIGRSRGIPIWTSVEDSVVIVGPPRSGKGLHLVIPMICAAPGPVVTTSTRPDNVNATLSARRGFGTVAVFDPQGLAPSLRDALRWSPIRGCEDPHIAMIRARALAAGGADQVENRSFWQAQTESALRAFLHAAALANLEAADLYRWSLDPAAAGQAVRILNASPDAATGWGDALDAIITGDPRTRDNSWAGIRTALSCLADPRVLAAVTPQANQHFDPARFLTIRATLYLLGTASGAGAAANLVSAFIEDIIDAARRRAAASTHARLDPPLALILDEAANYALPSLPALISEGGGTGITTVAVLQSLAQARARWGEHEGAAIWDAASVKVILGGGTNARDLHDLAAVVGERDEHFDTTQRNSDGTRTTSTSLRRIPILDVAKLRNLPFGTGILLLRAAPPVAVDLADQAR